MSDEMKRELQSLASRVAGMEVRVSAVETRLSGVETNLTQFRRQVAMRFDGVEQRIAQGEDRIIDAIKDVTGKLEGFSAAVEAARTDRKMSDQSFNYLKEHLFDHEARIVSLEGKPKSS